MMSRLMLNLRQGATSHKNNFESTLAAQSSVRFGGSRMPREAVTTGTVFTGGAPDLTRSASVSSPSKLETRPAFSENDSTASAELAASYWNRSGSHFSDDVETAVSYH